MNPEQVHTALTQSDIIQLISIGVALLIGIASILISIFTLRQNSKMIEESTRPVISIYSEYINTGVPYLYIVIKNFGQTAATITQFNYNYDFVNSNAYALKTGKDYLKDLSYSTLAPNQSRICALDCQNINAPVTFDIEYKSNSKTYNDTICLNLKGGATMAVGKSDEYNGDVLGTISYTLQEMLQKSL
ncbi:hypothetical protein KQI61_05955 [Anaerocolumna aminovalerica]|uniref:hypothetical protein n=1 Tax=Anaerocolumna aminovalerica TaxID=1527 RepID=UPI001C0ECC40|nr:hypothetical protein [Anaerocolumna aminovalerica]MBU5331734.1 hypothetical protein [Anaerocolumna aminovalerica]